MDPSKKLEFIHKMTKLGLEKVPHYDQGGMLPFQGNNTVDQGFGMATGLLGPTATGTVGQISSGGPTQQQFQGGPGLVGSATNPNVGVLGTLNGAVGLNDQFVAQGANITPGTNAAEINQAYNTAQQGIQGLQGTAATTAPGIGQGANAESVLSAVLANQAAGRGPNPAQAALNQETGTNVANTAALIAGGRGAATNPGLVAEQAARQGAATQQQAVGQSATMQAQQQLAAQQNLANLSANQIAQGQGAAQAAASAAQGEQGVLQGANTAYNNALVGMQSNINTTNAQTAATNTNMAGKLVGGATGAASSLAALFAKGGLVRMDKGGNVLDAEHRNRLHKDSFALPGRRYPIHDENHARNALARVSQYGTPAEKAKVRAAVRSKYPSIGVKKMAEGGSLMGGPSLGVSNIGLVPQPGAFPQTPMATSPAPQIDSAPLPVDNSTTPESDWSDAVDKWKGKKEGDEEESDLYEGGSVMPAYASGGSVATASPSRDPNGPQSFVAQWVNSNDLPASTASMPQGMANPVTQLAARGGAVKARDGKEKAQVKGDSLTNDKIPAMLSEGEGVIDRETMNDPGPVGQMARSLMKHINAKKKGGKSASKIR